MKVLFDHPLPFFLAHGGVQIQIEQTKAALESIGIEVDLVRWWDASQIGDLIHCFGAGRTDYLRLAHARGLPVVMTHFFSETANRPDWRLAAQGLLIRAILALPIGSSVKQQLTWTAFRSCDRLIVGLQAEKAAAVKAFGVDPARISVVPLGLPDVFLKAGPGQHSEDHLICTGTIYPVKQAVELATLARAAQVPVLFVGKPYHPADPYWLKFKSLVDGRWVKYQSHVETAGEMIRLLQAARGFVLFSQFENWSFSASEAVVCGLPLLLPDKKWARERFGSAACYLAPHGSRRNADILRQFHRDCPSLPVPKTALPGWPAVARQLAGIYEEVLKTSR